MPEETGDFNSRMEDVLSKIDNEELSNEEAPPVADSEAEKPIAEGEEKTSDTETVEPEKAIEPPVSWPGDDKEAFKSLPTWAQERIVSRENEREAHFAERSRTIAAREREVTDIQTRAQQAQEQYSGELVRLTQLASQLMPAKFSDIQSEADYLRMKVEDPIRAGEYEVFQQLLAKANNEQQMLQRQNLQKKMDAEWALLQEKFPEFKEPEKAKTIMEGVRKSAVDYYGFKPEEVAIIDDHRHVSVLRDAMAWRNHLANLKAAEGKKVPQMPKAPALRQAGSSGADLGAEQKAKLLKQARNTADLRQRAEMLAGIL